MKKITLIGGAPLSGKTTLSNEIAKMDNAIQLSTDSIRSWMKELVSKDAFSRNYNLASSQFSTAITEIDKSIDHLNKIKENLLKSDNNLRLANNKATDLTIKQLTANSPSVAEAFKKAKEEATE